MLEKDSCPLADGYRPGVEHTRLPLADDFTRPSLTTTSRSTPTSPVGKVMETTSSLLTRQTTTSRSTAQTPSVASETTRTLNQGSPSQFCHKSSFGTNASADQKTFGPSLINSWHTVRTELSMIRSGRKIHCITHRPHFTLGDVSGTFKWASRHATQINGDIALIYSSFVCS